MRSTCRVGVPPTARAPLHGFTVPAGPSGELWERAIIGRVMERGTWMDMGWLLGSFGRERLARSLAEREAEPRLLRPAPWPEVKGDLRAWAESLLAAP